MAGGNVVARAWVQIIPEMSGSGAKIAEGLNEAAESAGRQAGQRAGKSLGDSAAAESSAGGARAGASFGASLGARLSGIGGRLSSLFSGGLSRVKSLFSSSGTVSGSGFGTGVMGKLSGIGSRLSSTLTSPLSRVKSLFGASGTESGSGFGSGLTGKLSGVGGKLSSLLSGALSSVKSLFSSSGSASGSGFGTGVLGKLMGLGGRIVSGIGSGLSSIVSFFKGKGQSSGEGMGSSIAGGLSAKAAAIFAIAQNIANKVIQTISASVSSAVARVDTLNNFPKVLSNLGYSADESAAATSKLSDRLSSLPTKLDAAASGVQQLAPSSKSIDQATDRYLAFNDAILAGAASEDVQQNAMSQLTKAVSTGKMEMDTWMSIQQAMPGQLDQCAKHMLGQSASASDLYQAMKDGKVSVSDFADAMVDLDQNGGDGITSFADQATDAVGGIATSFSNMKNSVTKGVANVIQAIGAENIVSVINGVKGAINQAFSGIVSMVGPAKDAISQAMSGLSFGFYIVEETTGAFSLLAEALQGLGATAGPAIAILVQGALAVLPGILGSIAEIATPLIEAVTAALPVIAQMGVQVMQFAAELLAAVAPAIESVLNTITIAMPLIQAIWNAVWPVLSSVVITVFSAISSVIENVMGIVQSVISIVLGVINGNWDAVWGGISMLAQSVWNTICSVIEGAINIVSSVISGALSLINDLWSIAWNALVTLLSSAWSGIKSGVSSGISAVLGFLRGLPGQIIGIFSGAGSWLVESGKSLLKGFADGVMSAVGWVGDKISGALSQIRGLFPFSPAKWGPFSGHGYTTYSGGAAMEGFGEGAVKAAGGVSSAIGEALKPVEASFAVADVAPLSVDAPTWTSRLGGTVEAVSDAQGTGSDAAQIIAWFAQNLPQIINTCTPVLGERDAVRLARKWGIAGA